MKELTVKQLAAISGVTVRTLHHYDEIGLLSPAHIGANGYRYYGRAEMLRLQRILFHRELGVPLGEIAGLLELEGADQVGVLLRHREKLAAERERFRILIETIDRTVADIKGDTPMPNADLYKGFSAEKQAAYEAWLIERYGDPMKDDIARSQKARAKMSEAEQQAVMEQLRDIETALAEGMRRGIDPTAEPVDRLVQRHRAWVAAAWDKPCPPGAYLGLADLYRSHPDFVKRYETIALGFTDFLVTAMKAHAAKA
ncbi:MAG: MerR family transcriptional regulator [Alphaproteobacteria bacterium 32-64-14]|nr:MAG: MerR family transcriptional regulator [Alphaproteobacteria bacterium 32-64-14]